MMIKQIKPEPFPCVMVNGCVVKVLKSIDVNSEHNTVAINCENPSNGESYKVELSLSALVLALNNRK